MNINADMYNVLIMKILWILIVAVDLAQVIAKSLQTSKCLSYCDLLYSDWEIRWRPDCYCFQPAINLQNKLKTGKNILKLIPQTNLNHHEYTPKLEDGQNNNDNHDNHDLSQKLIHNYLTGFDYNKMNHTKVKRNSVDTENDNFVKNECFENNDTSTIENNLSACMNLHILLNKRNQNPNLKYVLSSDYSKEFENLKNVEILRENAEKCDLVVKIIQRSVAEIKDRLKMKRKFNKFDDAIPQTVTTIVSYFTFKSDYTNPTNAVDTTYYDDLYINSRTTTENSNNLNLPVTLQDSDEEEIRDEEDIDIDLVTKENNRTLKNTIINVTDVNRSNVSELKNSEDIKNSTADLSTDQLQNKSTIPSDYTDTEKKQTIIFKNAHILNNIQLREKYNESKPSIVRLITQELSNGSVLSFVNGTEILPNSDFEEITLKTEVQPINYVTTETASVRKETFLNITPINITGRLYFLYGKKQVPGYFVQNPQGALALGLDLRTFCEGIIPNENGKSLLSTLCNFLS